MSLLPMLLPALGLSMDVPPPPPLPEPRARVAPGERIASDPADAEAESGPVGTEVVVRRLRGQTIEEVRVGGHRVMVRVIPDNGPAYILQGDSPGSPLQSSPFAKEGPVRPVHFVVRQWR